MKNFAIACLLLVPVVGLILGWKRASEFDQFVQSQGGTWSEPRIDHRTSQVIYGIGTRKTTSTISVAREILYQNRTLLKINDPDAWRVESVETCGLGTNIRFDQMYRGFTVLGAEVSMHFNQQGQLIAVVSKAPPLFGNPALKSTWKDAENALRHIYGPTAKISVEGLVVMPHHPARLAWSALVETGDRTRGAWRFLLDAADVRMILGQGPEFLMFDGAATVWKENPVTTPARVESKLTYLDGSTELAGKYSKIFDANFDHDVNQPIVLSEFTTAKNPGRNFRYSPQDPRAVEAMAYDHITIVQDRYKALGFQGFGGRAAIFVNVAARDGGPGFDNAYYSASSQFRKTGIYVFGAGNEKGNTAEDADILYHEYSHGVLDKIAPALLKRPLESVYGFSIHEAFGDVAAAAINGNPRIGEFAFRTISTGKFEGRILANTRRFPQNVIWPEFGLSEPHYTSLILSGAWWDLQKLIGSSAAHRLFFDAAYLIPPDADFFDYRDAMLAADASAGGKDRGSIVQAFEKHGIKGASPASIGTVQAQRAVMRGPQIIKSDFSRGETIYFALEYDASGIAPGYYFVPDSIQFNQPPGSDAMLIPSLPEIFNGNHAGLKSAVLMEVITGASTLPGSYSISFTARRGCTDIVLGRYTVSFTLH